MKNTSTSGSNKNALQGISLFIMLFLLSWIFPAVAQPAPPGGTITFTLVKQPCDNDGILVATDTSAIGPTSFTWTEGGKTIFTQVTDSTSDTLYNYNGGSLYVTVNSPSQVEASYPGSPPFKFTDSTYAAVCPALGIGKVFVTGAAGPVTVQWLNTNSVVVATGAVVALPAGIYNVLITDSVGCVSGTYGSNNGTLTGGSNYPSGITIPNATSIKDTIATTPANCTNGTASVSKVSGGVAPYTYLWSNGSTDSVITGLHAGLYYLTVTDARGCANNVDNTNTSQYASVRQLIEITTHVTDVNPTCLQNNGSIIAFGSGGLTPYSYLWNNGQSTQTIAGLVAGTYVVTVTDANHCTGTYSTLLTSTTPITVTYSTKSSLCISPTGSSTLTITGGTPPYTDVWGTYPEQNGLTATNLTYGTYNFKVTDSVGCTRSGTVYIPPVSMVTGSIYQNDATCTQSNGSAGIYLNTGTAPYTYAWSNGGNTPVINGIPSGYYSVTVTDNLHCTVTKSTYVKSSSPIQLALIPTQASCIFNSDGQIAAQVTGGGSPYSYYWSNGETNATDTALATGRYWLYVHDTAGCVQSAWVDVGYNAANTSCYCTISGSVYLDSAANCIPVAGDAGIPNVMIHCNGLGYAFTDAYGRYSFLAPTGNYTVSEKVQSYYPLSPCQGNDIQVSVTAATGCIDTVNFGNVINPLHDIKICTFSLNNPPVVGYNYTQRIVVQNNGTVTEPNIQLGYDNDGQLQYTGVAPPLFVQQEPVTAPNWYSIIDTFPTLAPHQSQTFDVSYNVPANIPINTNVLFYDTVAYAPPMSNWLVDYTPWNNVNTYQTTTVGSFDPNEKEVMPVGTGVEGFIKTTDSILTYTVRFQNCGTYAAQKVVVIDTLSPNLDFATLNPGYSNYTYTADMSETGIAKFTFNNINLPDSNGQASASIGIIQYTVQQKPNLPGGTVIVSPATVYFDFNAGVQTNVTVNTIEAVTAVAEVQPKPFSFNLFPNPTAGHLQLSVQSEENAPCTMRFYNITGQLVKADEFQMNKGNNTLTTSVQSFSPGLYFVEISDGQYVSTRKVSVIE